jgi:hypothetical protein
MHDDADRGDVGGIGVRFQISGALRARLASDEG